MSRLLYFDCFSGISGDMVLGALLDAGLPLDDLKRALGQPGASDGVTHQRREGAAGGRLRHEIRRCATVRPRHRGRSTPGRRIITHHPHHHRSLSGDLRADRPVALCRRRAAIAPRRCSGGWRKPRRQSTRCLVETGAPARGRRPRFHHRYRRAPCSLSNGPARTDRLLALNVGGGMVDSAHGRVPGAGAGHRELLGSASAHLQRRRAERAGHADRALHRDGSYAVLVRPDPADAGRTGWLWGWRSQPCGDAERPACAHRPPADRPQASGSS